MELFRDGTDLKELPFLETLFAKLVFVLVVERWIESRHAISRSILSEKPRATVVHIAFHLGVPRVKVIRMKNDLELLRRLVELCRRAQGVYRIGGDCSRRRAAQRTQHKRPARVLVDAGGTHTHTPTRAARRCVVVPPVRRPPGVCRCVNGGHAAVAPTPHGRWRRWAVGGLRRVAGGVAAQLARATMRVAARVCGSSAHVCVVVPHHNPWQCCVRSPP